jgi:pyrroloquinoline quinone biosynthesis protein D
MPEAATMDLDAKPRLRRGVRLVRDAARGQWTLLAPERIFNADTVAAEVLKRCDGKATLASILDQLAAEFSTPRERIEADVRAMLKGLAEKRLLEF